MMKQEKQKVWSETGLDHSLQARCCVRGLGSFLCAKTYLLQRP